MAKAQHVDLSKMQGLLAVKGASAIPASDAVQRGAQPVAQSSNDDIVNLSFKVPSEFRKSFKLAAVNAGITQNELVIQALKAWKEKHSEA
jgi:hypothetical protein